MLTRHRWLVLTAVAVLAAAAHLMLSAWYSWHFIVAGSQDLIYHSGLHLYGRHPELQMGPLTFLLGAVFVVALPAQLGQWLALAVMVAAGLVALRDTWYIAGIRTSIEARRWLLAAMAATLVWSEVAVHFAHLDDAMALVLMVRAIRLGRDGRTVPAAVFVALATDFKPWAIPAAAVLLADTRRLRTAVAVLAGLLLLAWAPFFLADPATVRILHFGIPVSHASSLKMFGVTAPTTPPWDRYAQLGGGLLLAVAAVLRRRWSAVMLLIIAFRMLLDPAAYTYYDSGLLLGTVILDGAAGRRIPVATAVAFLTVDLSAYALPPVAAAPIRTAGLLLLLLLALLRLLPSGGPLGKRSRRASHGAHPPLSHTAGPRPLVPTSSRAVRQPASRRDAPRLPWGPPAIGAAGLG